MTDTHNRTLVEFITLNSYACWALESLERVADPDLTVDMAIVDLVTHLRHLADSKELCWSGLVGWAEAAYHANIRAEDNELLHVMGRVQQRIPKCSTTCFDLAQIWDLT